MQADGSQFEVFAETGGRPLGLDFDAQGRVIVADAMQGLLAIGPDRKITVLLDKLTPPDGAPPDGSPPDGSPPDNIRYANSVVVAKNGKIYLSDASQRFAPRQFGGTFHASILDILEHSATGRVIEFDPASAKARVVFKDLAFANGLALSQDEKSLFVVETGEYRVWKLDLQAQNLSARQNSPMAHLLLANLPGYPDNLMRGREGRIWLGLAKPRAGAIDNMAQRPWLRKVTLRLPKFLWPVPKAYGHVIAFHEDGKIVQDMQDPAGAYPETTGVLEAGNQLFIQSLHAHAIGWLPDSVMLGSGK
jgi:sugar lactone lactonase YvrE